MSARTETATQLDQLRARLVEDHPEIYRHWALYLQVLREGLQQAVDQACFRLAVDCHPERYSALKPSTRQELHRRLAQLVQRCCALLTVEQLAALAQQTRRRRQRAALRQRRRWLASLQQPQPPELGPPIDLQPQGSINLGLAPPISTDFLAAGSAFKPLLAPDGSEHVSEEDAQQDEEVRQALSQWLEQVSEREPEAQTDTDDSLLPSDPIALLTWIDDQEQALARRLRNLSHGINVELVRLGLSTTLLPLRLLEAIAQGQLETHNAPLNLVKVSLPMAQLPEVLLPEALAVLLRSSDLEAQMQPLRTCRSRLQQSRQEVRRMAQTYQRLQRRLQTLDAEQLWLNDHSTAHPTSQVPKG